MTYKTIVTDYAPRAKKMAAAIEQTANAKAQEGWELVTFSVNHKTVQRLMKELGLVCRV